MLTIKTLEFNVFQENCYIVSNEGGTHCVIIDPGFYYPQEEKQFFDTLFAEGLKVDAVLLTHGHSDHIYGVARVQKATGCRVYMHPADKGVIAAQTPLLKTIGIREPDSSFTSTDIAEGGLITEAGITFKVIHTPGHTPGGVCYLVESEKVLFTGDTLFAGTIGRTDFDYSDYDKEIAAIMEKLIILDSDISVLPGHGPSSTIGDERTHNPMLEPFNEPEEKIDPDLPGITITR